MGLYIKSDSLTIRLLLLNRELFHYASIGKCFGDIVPCKMRLRKKTQQKPEYFSSKKMQENYLRERKGALISTIQRKEDAL